MIVVPKVVLMDFDHGKNTEVFYLVDAVYTPEDEDGIRWNDPTFKIEWPMVPKVISLKIKIGLITLSDALSEKKYLTDWGIIIYWLLVRPKIATGGFFCRLPTSKKRSRLY